VKRTLNIAIVAALILGVASVAAAVAGSTRSPRPGEIPVMVTDRSAVATPTVASSTSATGTAGGRAIAGKKTAAASAAKKASASRGRTTSSSASRPSGGGSGKPTGNASSPEGSDDDKNVEVVKPPVHEEDESSEGSYNPGETESDSD